MLENSPSTLILNDRKAQESISPVLHDMSNKLVETIDIDEKIRQISQSIPDKDCGNPIQELTIFCKSHLRVDVDFRRYEVYKAPDFVYNVQIYFGNDLICGAVHRKIRVAKEIASREALDRLKNDPEFVDKYQVNQSIPDKDCGNPIQELTIFCKSHLRVDVDFRCYDDSEDPNVYHVQLDPNVYHVQLYFGKDLIYEAAHRKIRVAKEIASREALDRLKNNPEFLKDMFIKSLKVNGNVAPRAIGHHPALRNSNPSVNTNHVSIFNPEYMMVAVGIPAAILTLYCYPQLAIGFMVGAACLHFADADNRAKTCDFVFNIGQQAIESTQNFVKLVQSYANNPTLGRRAIA